MKSKIIKNTSTSNSGDMEGEFLFRGNKVSVLIENGTDLEYAEKCINYLNNLSDDVLIDLCKSAFYYYKDYVKEEYIEEYSDVKELSDILKKMQFQNLLVENKDKHSEIGFNLSGKCLWEEEHGFEWVVRDGKTLIMSWNNNTSPWNEEDFYKKYSYNFSCRYYVSKESVTLTQEQIDKLKEPIKHKENKNLGKTRRRKLSLGEKIVWLVVVAILTITFGFVFLFQVKSTIYYHKVINNYPYTSVTGTFNEKCETVTSHDSEYGEIKKDFCTENLIYKVNGKTYETRKIEKNGLTPDIIYYNPDNPSEYYLINQSEKQFYLDTIVSFALFVICLCSFIFLFRRFKKD